MKRAPAIFLGHGSPMNTFAQNAYARALGTIAELGPRPEAVLMVSAHWETQGTKIQASERPKTIHDFRGFPKELHEFRYPVAGSPEWADETRRLLTDLGAETTLDWGLDHGAWSVLTHVFPRADVPVFQLSLDRRLDPAAHFAIGQRLAPLRERGVWIVGSGDIVHNLYEMNPDRSEAYAWAQDFEREVRTVVDSLDFSRLLEPSFYASAEARKAVPSFEHFAPLLYVLGAASPQAPRDELKWIFEGFELGTISLSSFALIDNERSSA